jgi:hypothetical protein
MVLWRKCWSRFQFRNSVTLTDGLTQRGCATISDKDEITFFLLMAHLFTTKNKIMANGYLIGNRSSTQSAIIVPRTETHMFIIFSP